MTTPRILFFTFGACVIFLLTASLDTGNNTGILLAQGAAKVANPITGEGLPNPAPKVTRNWGELPAGRKWGTSAGIDIDPRSEERRVGKACRCRGARDRRTKKKDSSRVQYRAK